MTAHRIEVVDRVDDVLIVLGLEDLRLEQTRWANSVVIRLPACIGISPTATRGTTYNTTPLLPLARFRAATWGR